MKTKEFDFFLPPNLIAQFPPEKRGQSRLMTLDRNSGLREHKKILDLPGILCEERFLSSCGEKPLLVFNDTKVRKARLIGKSAESGANAEFLLLDKTSDNETGILNDEFGIKNEEQTEWKTLVQRAGRRKVGSRYIFFDTDGVEIAQAEITREEGEFRFLRFDKPIDDEWLDRYGHIPLPPYIKRSDAPSDADRYQTVYANETGSAAAPTAGLHFTGEILEALAARGIERAFVTLHVGLGTFQPVRSENIEDHVMHEERFIITESNAQLIENAIAKKQKIIAVGTTSMRTLESAYNNEQLKRGWQSTSIFIYPGYKFKITDVLFTNFHTPLSTLLMLVCAFAGKDFILESYKEAVKEEYKFFSYGDAMIII